MYFAVVNKDVNLRLLELENGQDEILDHQMSLGQALSVGAGRVLDFGHLFLVHSALQLPLYLMVSWFMFLAW